MCLELELELASKHTLCQCLWRRWCHMYPQGNLCIYKTQWRLRVATSFGNPVMGVWKYPEEVTNERCKVKCPVKSSGDLKQAAFTASGRFPQTIIRGTRPALSSVWPQVSVAATAHLHILPGLGMSEPPPPSPLSTPRVTAETWVRQPGVPPQSRVSESALACSLPSRCSVPPA